MSTITTSRINPLFKVFLLTCLTLSFLAPLTRTLAADEKALATETPGVLRVGMEANYAPFNWTQTSADHGAVPIANSKGEYANGYDVSIAKRLADELGLKLEVIKTEWDGLPPSVMSGKIDAIIAGMSPTKERLEQVDFSDSYYQSNLVIVTPKDSPFAQAKHLKDFGHAKITGQLNTFHYEVIDQIPGVNQVTAMDSFPTMISAAMSAKIDGYVSEKPGAMAAVAANPSLTFVEFNPGDGFDVNSQDTSIAVGIKKGSPLTPAINEALAKISEEERNHYMQEAVDLNVAEEEHGFWTSIASLLKNYGSSFVRGALMTLFIALVATLIGFVIGLYVAIIKKIDPTHQSKVKCWLIKVGQFLLQAYIEIFRGTPMMVQAMLIFYGSKLFFNIDMSSLFAALLIVSINTGAYLSEVVRGGIESVDHGQYEGAIAIGMSHGQAMRQVILPQAIRNVMPAIGNEFVINIKDTSVLNVIAVTELFFVTKSAAGSTYLIFQSFFITCVIYFVLTFSITRLLRYLERRMDGPRNYDLIVIEGGDSFVQN